MARGSPPGANRERGGESASELERLRSRLERTEQRTLQVENALRAVTREATGLSVGGPCNRCHRSLLLVGRGEVSCPQCGYRHSR
ncbi:hypothetical protein [Halomicrobium urmianum]|uniref:hypothetical protein n=1 Tax=Halomicrobium urmianum TaxID=1586233 RepID=UPI001CD9F2BF|nr:hypothetical protein [Halomicrobium urmianum]